MPALLVLASVGLFFCFTPGLDAPNYHGAFVLTLVAGVVGGVAGVFAGHRAATDVLPPARHALKRMLLPAFAPLILLVLNGLRVRQCDVALGIAFHLLGPIFTALWSTCIGAWIGAVLPRRRHGILAFAALWLVWVGLDVAFILTEPAIFAFNPFGGYFSGNLYDTVIPIDDRYLSYRLVNLVQLAFAAAIFRLGWHAANAQWRRHHVVHAPIPHFIAALVAGVFVVGALQARETLGHQIDASDIARSLGGRIENDRLTLIYDRARIPENEARRLFEDHLFRLDQLETALGSTFAHRITSWVYGDEHAKKRMMGAGRVYLAKPWLREIHLNRMEYGDPVVMHELAHIVLGMYAPPPLHIPTRLCVVPNMALVEGAAEAFEWDTGALTSHEWSATLRATDIAPPLDRLLGPAGFYLQSSGLAYTMAGSFIRWLIDTRGMAPFTRLYADGDFDLAYGQSVEALVGEWETFLGTQKTTAEAAIVAASRFKKRAIFFQVCGLDVARKEAEGHAALARNDIAAAKTAFEQIVQWVPEDAEKRLPLIDIAARSADPARVVAAARDYFALDQRLTLSDVRVLETIADTHMRRGELVAASFLYPLVAAFPMPAERLRTIAVKTAIALGALGADPPRAGLARYMFGGDVKALEVATSDPLAIYLAARRHHGAGRHADAIPLFEQALALLPEYAVNTPRLDFAAPVVLEAWRLLGRSRFFAGQYDAATVALDRFIALTPTSGDAIREADWLKRIDWYRERP